MLAKRMNILDKDIFYEAAKKYGTPLYFYDLGEIKRRIKLIEDTLKDLNFKIFFAMKANSNPYILKFMRSYGIGADAVSLNEYKIARFVGFSPSEIVVNGNGKSIEDISFYANEKPMCVNVDSYEEIKKIGDLPMRIALRINPNVDPKTHPHISTGLKENKFGMDFETAKKVIRSLPNNLRLVGLHCHIGSQITEADPFIEAFSSLKSFVKEEKLDLEFINVGGGWGIDYMDKNDGINLNRYKSDILPILTSFDLPIYFELGRFIVGSSGYLLTKVTEVKRTPHKNFVIVDASMADLIRPALYDAHHEIEFLSGKSEMIADVAGRVCESGDVFAHEIKVNVPEIGEIGLIHDAGAYGYSMSSNYNLSTRPAEVVFDGDKFILIRKRENFEDLLGLIEEE